MPTLPRLESKVKQVKLSPARIVQLRRQWLGVVPENVVQNMELHNAIESHELRRLELKRQDFWGKRIPKLQSVLQDCKSVPDSWKVDPPEEKVKGALVTTTLDHIGAERVDWLWVDRLAYGKLNCIQGSPGVGKTFLLLDILARVTTGRAFPDGAKCRQGEVLFITGEDGHGDTVRPRIDTMQGDPSKVHVLETVKVGDREDFLSLDEHLSLLDEWLADHEGVVAVGIDPISCFLGKTNSHRENEVRALLSRLAKVLEKHNVAGIVIGHLKKGQGKAIDKGMGSIGFTGAARAVWQVAVDPDDDVSRLLLPVKTNLAKVDGLAFRINDGKVLWKKGKVTVSADAVNETEDGDTPRSEAKTWLLDVLANGPVPAKEIERRGREDGITKRTLSFAKKELGIKSQFSGTAWSWLPPMTPANEKLVESLKGAKVSKGVSLAPLRS